ncbi:MAG: sodium:proton antiporter NhaD [Schleiferiaceae bacterium]|nr:sodium:proton antiporter NhaD [Schleiferiaceae bacterium]
MYILMVVVFVLGYVAITLEHSLRVDKAGIALVTGILCWTLYVLGMNDIVDFDAIPNYILSILHGDLPPPEAAKTVQKYVTHHQLLEHLAEIASILFFLIGAMTIVELIDEHQGFAVITDKINTTNRVKLLWIVGFLSFIFSATLDNLTASIVMISLLRKLIYEKQNRWFFAGIVVVAANAGGAWSPIGDVTTTMLWIGGHVTTGAIVTRLILPSIFCLVVPLIFISFRMKGTIKRPRQLQKSTGKQLVTSFEQKLIFFAGLGGLIFVPIFKSVTHLPPFMGIMLSLGFIWLLSDILHRNKSGELRHKLNILHALKKIDMASVLFFLGILLAVGALQSAGQLGALATGLDNSIGTNTEAGVYSVGLIIGLLSSIVDNVPLVAAAMGMYPLAQEGFFMQDGLFWEFLAYCAGTGGSALIIGSASGVAVMGLEKITFGWYLKNISFLAILGYFSGAIFYVVQYSL